ncbi:proton/peptide symporter family protein [Fictibacillus macauensis ZFHKF-1]|uniref:Proton/peptide symporter family protein n=1 Tax=Fictibacillus macauensis ZFHKF-1 TaxID=1196324 RepID=I8UII9_9BACL|nr:oligopeptide:H+ symporter [Fictibacillus macauensis]EIT86638.1 proton/peptide symporter family protein [Fictibacillus macauensis ZFHKF-1]
MEATANIDQDGHVAKKKKHPPGLYLLFFTELWERFSYYGMRALLVLYLTKSLVSGGLAVETSTAYWIYSIFTGAVYFTPLIGGYLSDRYLGRRLAITMGGITIALGNVALFSSQSKTAFFLGLALLIIGNGFFKPNISTLVGELYPATDSARKDAAFTIFYMGINIGAFFSPLVVGYLSDDLFKTTVNGVEQFGYRYGFLASAIGMIIGQIIFNLLATKYLGTLGTKPVGKQGVSRAGVQAKQPLSPVEKKRVSVIFILTFFVIFFMAGFEQAGSSLTIYADKFIDRTMFGWTVPTAWFQSLNPLFIVIFAPILSLVWVKLAKSKRGDFSTPTKMALGLILLGLGFAVLMPALLQTGTGDTAVVKANMIYMVLLYFLHTIGELCLQPIGLSMVSKLAPVKLASLMMGVWLAGSGVANLLGGQLASTTESLGYFKVFIIIGSITLVLGLILLTLSKKLVKMSDGRL